MPSRPPLPWITGCRAASESIDLHPHSLGEWNKQVGQGRVVADVVGDVRSVLVAAAGDDDRQVVPIVGTGISQIRAEQDRRVIEQRPPVLVNASQSCSGTH